MVRELSFLVLFMLIFVSSSIVSIEVGNAPSFILCNSGYIYVTNYNSSTVSIINPSNNEVISTIAVGSQPISMVSAGNKIYVALAGCDKIVVLENNKIIRSINLTSSPCYMAYDPKDQELFVIEPEINSLGIIKNCSLIKTINLDYQPDAIAFDPKNCLLYIGGGCNGVVYVYNTEGKLNTTYYIGGRVVYVNYCNGNIFVTSWINNELTIINSSGVFHFSAGLGPYDAIYDPSDGYIYVSDVATGSILVLSLSGSVIHNISVGGRPSILMYKNGNIYVVNSLSNNVIIIPQVPPPPPPYCLYYLIAGGIGILVIVGYFVIKKEIR